MTGQPVHHTIGEAEISIYPADPEIGDRSDMYVMYVFGVSVLVRRRAGDPDNTFVHVDDEGIPQDFLPLLVEIRNTGEVAAN